MSKINPEPNLIHIMGCYVLGNPNGEKVRPFVLFRPSVLGLIPGVRAGFGPAQTEVCFLDPTAVPEAEEPDEALFCGV